MNLRKRKKEPPDPWLSIFDFPIANSYLVDLAISLPISRAPFPAIPFPCPLLDFALFSVSKPFPIYSPPQPVVGLQFTTRSTRGSASTPRMVLSPQFRGPRPGIVERSCQGSRFCTEHGVTEWSLLAVSLVFHLAVFRSEAQVCFFTFPLQTCCCNCVLCTSGALPSFCHLPPILALGKRFGLVPESTRPCAEVLAGHGGCQHRRLWVATPSIFGCRHRSKYSGSPWPSSHGLRPRVVCIRSKPPG
uniref:Uncharacterized protein n=1 Tax=Opuntia streptacantha TaxID=393608 RepID=A0A7C9CZ36_OPUST